VVAAVDEIRQRSPPTPFEDGEQYFAGSRAEGAHDVRFADPRLQYLRARFRLSDDQMTVVLAHWQSTRQHRLAGQAAGLLQHVADARPVHSEQQYVSITNRLGGCAGSRVPSSFLRQPLQLPLVVRIAEHNIVASPRQQRSQLAAHQSRTEHSDTHGTQTRRAPASFRHNSRQ